MTDYLPVYVLRHGQTKWNVQNRLHGHKDSPLTPLGRRQAQQQHAVLERCQLAGFRAYSSPQTRAVVSATIAFGEMFPDIHTDDRLREIGIGEWAGQFRQDVGMDRPFDATCEVGLDRYEQAPGGEGFAALADRCTQFLERLTDPAVIMTHGVTSRMLRLMWLRQDINQIGRIDGGQGVVFQLRDNRQHRLTIGA